MVAFENLRALQGNISGTSMSGGRVNIGLKITPKKKELEPTSVNLSINIMQDAGRPPMLVGSVSSKGKEGKIEGLSNAQATFTYALPETKDVRNILKQSDPVVALADLTEKDSSVRGMVEDMVTRAIFITRGV
jgi:hypothetical protein